MKSFICTTCGTVYPPAAIPPACCKICEDERQYVDPNGQSWTDMSELNKSHQNIFQRITPDLFSISVNPTFAIGQKAYLLIAPGGNILWDCISNIDQDTIEYIMKLGGLKSIAISHPHFFSALTSWSTAFGDIPIYINEKDKNWLHATDMAHINFWDGRLSLEDGLTLVHCGGHFPGSCILHSSVGEGAIFVGDTIQVSADLKSVSFMYSYPNFIPLPKADILKIGNAIKDLKFEAIYGAFGRIENKEAKSLIKYSIKRYLRIFG